MIESTLGNLLDANADALINTVNCVGIMGKGIALQFKQAFPEMFRAYEKEAKAGRVMPGTMHVFETGMALGPRYIINFPTKRHWKERSSLGDIEAGLADLVRVVKELGIDSIAIPPLGSGNGGLDWALVRPTIVTAFKALPDVKVLLYERTSEPIGTARRAAPSKPPLTTSRALFLRLMDLYLLPAYDLTLIEVQKLAYFLQAAGQPLRLRYVGHFYGPYAQNLDKVLQVLEGHYLHGAINNKPDTTIGLTPNATEEAKAFLDGDDDAQERLALVSDLIEGFETPYGMELLATVHWLVAQDHHLKDDVEACVNAVHAWSGRKRSIFQPNHIRSAWRHLQSKGWFQRAV